MLILLSRSMSAGMRDGKAGVRQPGRTAALFFGRLSAKGRERPWATGAAPGWPAQHRHRHHL
jgi:hypothetical protein